LERDVSERHSFEGYDFEVRGHDLVIRDAQGAVVETVNLETIDGEFQLPNGQQVDLASLLLNKKVDPADFETAAGGAEGAGAPESGPIAFRTFDGDENGFTNEATAGTLDDTSLSYSVIDGEQGSTDQRAFAETAIFTEPTNPVNWASRGQWGIPENQDGGDFGRLIDGDPADFKFVVSDDRFDVVDGILQLKDGFSFDFETESFIDVQITATSKTGESKTQSVRIDVIDENEGQAGIDLDNALVVENAAGAVIGKLTVTDPDAGDSQSFQLSDNRFEVVNGELKLKDGISLDFEAEPSVNVTVTAIDKGGHSISQQFTIVVSDANEAPTALSLDHNAVLENAAGAVIGGLTVADPDSGDSQSFVVSDSRFEILNGELKLKDGMSIDFETEQTIDMTVTATDKGGHSISQDFSIIVGDVNEAQTALSLNGAYVAENAAGSVVGDLTVADPDKGDNQTFAVSDNRFEVVNGQLKLKDGVSLDFESEPTVNVTVTATDKGGHSIAEQFTLGVGNVNEAPLSLTLTTTSDQLLINGSFEVDKLNNGQWKLFSGIDGWKTDTQVEIQNNVTNKASNGAQVVELDADHAVDNLYQSVKTTAGHVYELSFDTSSRGDTKHTDAIEVYWNGMKVGAVDPQSTTWQTSTFQVIGTGGDDRLEFREVGGKNDSYGGLLDNVSLKGMGSSVPENFAGAVIGALNVTDPDVGDTHSFKVSDSRFEVVDGQLKLKDGVAFNYEAEQSVTVTVTATDTGGNTISKDFTINVVDVNEAPAVTVKDGAVDNHVIDVNLAYSPAANAEVGNYLYSNDNSSGKRPDASLMNGVAGSNMVLTAPTEVTATFQKESAGNHNMVGTYQYDDVGNIIPGSVKFVWLDASATNEGKIGSGMVNDFLGFAQANTVSLGTMAAGTHVGFFTISNGASFADNKTLLTGAAGGAATQAAAMAAIASQLSIKTDANGNAHVFVGNSQMSGDTFFTHDKSLNTDFKPGSDIDHMASGVSSKLDHQLIIGVEDLNGGGDRDYNDVVFSVNLGSYNVEKTTQNVTQPSVDFSDVDSHSLSQAVIHTTGFQSGDSLTIPGSALFNVTVNHASNDYTIIVVGKTGAETVDQDESFVNSIHFATTSTAEGTRQIAYNIVDEGGLASNVGTAKIGVSSGYEIASSEIAASQHQLGSGNDHFYLNGSLKSNVDFGDGYDTLHLARAGEGLTVSEMNRLDGIEAIDATGYGMNKVALSINDVLDMTDGGNHLTILGDKGDTVTLSGDNSGHHWSVASTGNDFTTYVWSDPLHQAVVEISNQLTATLST
jgi:VCBS repeat-containing protein